MNETESPVSTLSSETVYVHILYISDSFLFIWESSSICHKRIGIVSSGSEVKHMQMFGYKLNPKSLANFFFTEHNTPLFVTGYLYLQVEPCSFSSLLHIFRYSRWYIRNSTIRLYYWHITTILKTALLVYFVRWLLWHFHKYCN